MIEKEIRLGNMVFTFQKFYDYQIGFSLGTTDEAGDANKKDDEEIKRIIYFIIEIWNIRLWIAYYFTKKY